MAIAPCPIMGTTENILAPSSWHPLLRYLCALVRSLSVSSRPNRPISLSLSSEERLSGLLIILIFFVPFTGSSPVVSCLFSTEEPRSGHSPPGMASPEMISQEITSLDLLVTLFLMHPRIVLAFQATWAPCWLIIYYRLDKTFILHTYIKSRGHSLKRYDSI